VKRTYRRIYRFFFAAATGATLFASSDCWAAGQAVLPWDYTLDVIQNFVAGPLARSVIVISGIVAIVAFVLADDSEVARRSAKAVIGAGIVLIAVQLLNYLAP
jgi:type IV secretory pathway VirB2 component (pilin)